MNNIEEKETLTAEAILVRLLNNGNEVNVTYTTNTIRVYIYIYIIHVLRFRSICDQILKKKTECSHLMYSPLDKWSWSAFL